MMSRKLSIIAIVVLLVLMGSVAYFLFLSHNETHPLSPSSQPDLGYHFTTQVAQDYPPLTSEQGIVLPDDFNFHRRYQHEWWRMAANVTTASGEHYGIHWQFIRLAHDSEDHRQLYLAQVAISDRSHHWYAQRIARSGSGQAGLTMAPFDLWIDDWRFTSETSAPLPGELQVMTKQWGMQLALAAAPEFVLPGQAGLQTWGRATAAQPVGQFSVLGWQVPNIAISGRLTLPNHAKPVDVSGQAWLEQSWGNQLLLQPNTGRDWIVFHLASGETLSVTRFREYDQPPQVQGLLTLQNGDSVNLSGQEITMTPTLMGISGQSHHIPYQWHVVIPSYQMDFTVTAVNRSDWLPLLLPNWAGPVNVSGSHAATGFMQLTGY